MAKGKRSSIVIYCFVSEYNTLSKRGRSAEPKRVSEAQRQTAAGLDWRYHKNRGKRLREKETKKAEEREQKRRECLQL